MTHNSDCMGQLPAGSAGTRRYHGVDSFNSGYTLKLLLEQAPK